MTEWLTASEMAALIGVTPQRFNAMVRENGWREPGKMHSQGNQNGIWQRDGGVVRYHYSLLPSPARAKLRAQQAAPDVEDSRKTAKQQLRRNDAWARYQAAPDKRKARADARLAAMLAVRDLVSTGMAKDAAVRLTGKQQGFSASSFYAWESLVAGVPLVDWRAYLVDHYTGRQPSAEVSPEAWDMFLGDYLRNGQPGLTECYVRLKDAAKLHGWTIPSIKTLERKLHREIPARVIKLRREGEKEHDRTLLPQRRDRTGFRAMEALNYDGHKLDVFVEWPDGKEGRAILLAFQDLRSNKIVGWRVDRSESAEAFRLAFGDVVEAYGYPDIIYSDNTMAAAAKANTGGTRFRHRYKAKDDDFMGLFPALGIDLRFTKPAHGQSKPIERSFGVLARYISRAPECEGASTGNSPENKPANYGSATVKLDVLLAVCEREINRYNSEPNRDSSVAHGVSFDQVFDESYKAAPIRKPLGRDDPARRFWLLAVEAGRCNKHDGHIELYRNRYWEPWLIELAGKKVAVRYDPDRLHDGVYVYRLDGSYAGFAACHADVGFADRDAAKEHSRNQSALRRATRDAEKLQNIMDAAEVARQLPRVEGAPPPEARVIRGNFKTHGSAALKADAAPDDGERLDAAEFARVFSKGLRLVQPEG